MHDSATIVKNKSAELVSNNKRPDQSPFFRSIIQPKLTINQPNDNYEQEADAVAEKVMRMPDKSSDNLFFQPTPLSISSLQRKCSPCQEDESVQLKNKVAANDGMVAPSIVNDVINSTGQPLDGNARQFMENRFGYDFAGVQIHNDPLAHRSTREMNALAYTHGNHVAFGAGEYKPETDVGKHLLAHELAHVVQQNLSKSTSIIQNYRSKGSANFKACDTTSLQEESFDKTKDKKTKPWIEKITIKFDATTTDSDGDIIPTGSLEAVYFDGTMSTITSKIAGGKASQGLTDVGDPDHTVKRIEGCGYHHEGVPKAEQIKKHDRAFKYFKDTTKATMNFAVFFVQSKGSGNQAIHEGSFTQGSLACVHVPDPKLVQQINYHSVVGLTKVNISYDSVSLKTLCCERFKVTGRMVKNPCKGQDSKKCP